MKELEVLLEEIIFQIEIIEGNLSNPRKREDSSYNKVDIKPVEIRDEIKIQFTYNYKSKVHHDNLDLDKAKEKLMELFGEFRQAMFFTKKADYQILISKRGKVKILSKSPSKEGLDLAHNRKKQYILEEGKPCDFLIRLGVMTKDGRVVARRYDKFRQINRFLEMVEDVIKFCNQVAQDLDYKGLKFIHGDIEDYKEAQDVDMVVTLHACDTATDAALLQAIEWEAKIILSVPCCQHEFFDKIENPVLEPMLKHGIVRDKLASLVTDSLRAKLLEILGYEVQLLEFIDMEHTPKNILIRAIKTEKRWKVILSLKNFGICKIYTLKESLGGY